MSYYILPKINSQLVIQPSITSTNEIKPYISHSLLQYVKTIENQINNLIINSDDLSLNEIVNCVNNYEYIFSKIPGSKYSVSKLKPSSNLFYDFLEICNSLNLFDPYENVTLNSLHISKNISDTIECFEMLRENYNDKITSYHSFDDAENSDAKFDFLIFEQSFVNLNNYFIFLKHCLTTILKCQMKNGCCVIKIDNLFYKPVIDFVYFLSSLYDKVYILKPNSSNITTNEKYIICKNYQCKTDFCNINKENNDENNDNKNNDNDNNDNIISSFLNFDTPYYFLSKIEDINVIIGYQQLESLNLVLNIVKNKNREDKMETLKKANILKSITWCEKHKIPCNKFSERVNIFLPLAKEEKDTKSVEENIVISTEI